MICDHPDDPGRRHEGRAEQEGDLFAHLPGADEQPEGEHDREREKRVHVKEGHRRVDRPLDPPGEQAALAAGRFVGGTGIIFSPPVQQEEQPGGNRVEQPTLGYEHRERNALPRDLLRLVVRKVKLFEKLEAGKSAIKKKTGDPKRATPAIESVKGRE